MTGYEPTIGLEIHVELKTRTKMFCDSLNDPDEKHPNLNVCPVCMAFPGTLPVINEEAVRKVILTGLALNCQIARRTNFDRKNYFYPDLPKGYQISQYQRPLCAGGYMEVAGRKIHLTRIHLEEDTGRLQHDAGGDYSLVDFNRAGVPLMEMVTEPELTTGEEVKEFAEKFRLLLRYLGVSDADMEKGQMRVEVNISLRPKALSLRPDKLGTKVEIKNLNSIKSAASAVNYEIKRQIDLLNSGQKVAQETRGWDDVKETTFSQRLKETAKDYRYFPEPDLPLLNFEEDYIESIRARLPELPKQRRTRLKKEYGLNDSQTEIFIIARHLGDYFEKVVSELDKAAADSHRNQEERTEKTVPGKLYVLAANYIITELPSLMNARGMEIDELEGFKIEPEAFAELIMMIFSNKLSSSAAKAVLKEMAVTGLHPEAIAKEKNLLQVSDPNKLETIVVKVLSENSKAAEDYKKGKKEVMNFLVGQVMAESKGQANTSIVAGIILEKLSD